MATLNISVATDSDDCMVFYFNVWVLQDLAGIDQVAGYFFGGRTKYGGGMRFLNVTIPRGSTIKAAHITLVSNRPLNAVTVNSKITGEDVDNAATYSTLADYQARRGTVVGGATDDYLTTAQVNWNDIQAWVEGTPYNSPDIASIIQEIINREGWVSGNALALWWDDHNGLSTQANYRYRIGASYGDPTYAAPLLHIEYDAAPIVTTQAVSNIGGTTATGNGNITDLGDANPTAHGVCWGTSHNPTIADDHTDEGAASEIGAFTSAITELTAGTLYYVRAYATNFAGTGYGDEVSFTTLIIAPTVTTDPASSVEEETAIGNGNVTDLGGESLTQHGHCWSTSHNPTTSDDKTELGAKSETGAFTSSLTDLTPNTVYYCRAYATNSAGTSYGDEVTFTTEVDMAEVTTDAATIVKETSATLNGTLDDDGGEACDVRFQYGFTTDYGTNTDWQSGKETEDTFSQAIAELVGGTLYHFRAQARNSAGTVNGNDRTFTTITPFVKKRAHSLARDEL